MSSSPGHDDDAHVPVLINRSVTENQLAQAGYPARRLTVLSSVLFSQTLVSLFTAAVEAVGKWKAQLAFQAQRLFHGLLTLRPQADVDTPRHGTEPPRLYVRAYWRWRR